MKILWVKVGGLVPLDTGGKIRSFNILRELARRHHVTFFTSYEKHDRDVHGDLEKLFAKVIRYPLRIPRSRSLRHILRYAGSFFSQQPHQLFRYYDSQAAAELLHLIERENFDVIVCDFLAAAAMIPWQSPTPKVLFTHNVEALIWKRHYAVARNAFWKAVCWREYRATALTEERYLNLADHVLTVSETDRGFFAQKIQRTKISVVPTGVDLDFFRPAEREEESNVLVFTGSMDWMPNQDGILYFVNEILPRVRKRIPSASLLVVGRSPSPQVVELSQKIEGIHVTGTVEDIRPYVRRGSVYIVPLRVGSGTRLKIFEAMAMGKAVVSTTIGAEGLPVQSGRDIFIADSPEQFANAVVGLLQDPVRRQELGQAARRLVTEKHGWDSVVRHFESALESVGGPRWRVSQGSI
jgi:polysaccharide biosynthesis protein PslH